MTATTQLIHWWSLSNVSGDPWHVTRSDCQVLACSRRTATRQTKPCLRSVEQNQPTLSPDIWWEEVEVRSAATLYLSGLLCFAQPRLNDQGNGKLRLIRGFFWPTKLSLSREQTRRLPLAGLRSGSATSCIVVFFFYQRSGKYLHNCIFTLCVMLA